MGLLDENKGPGSLTTEDTSPSIAVSHTNYKHLDMNTNTPETKSSKGSNQLLKTRKQIKSSSAAASCARRSLQEDAARAYSQCDIDALRASVDSRRTLTQTLKEMRIEASESGFSRPVSGVAFQDQNIYAGDWAGKVYKLNHEYEIEESHQVHTGKVCLSKSRLGLLSGGLEGNILLHQGSQGTTSVNTSIVRFPSNHRVACVQVHPRVDVLAGAYFDKTWKLWDIETQNLLMEQKGHSKEVYTVSFHPDGSLIASAGLDGIARLWDLRSGKPILVLNKHIREIYAMDWCSDGYTLATGGADNNVLIWDIRSNIDRLIPAHTSIVSDVKYIDTVLVTASYDKTVKLWNTYSGSLLDTKSTGEKVLAIDLNLENGEPVRDEHCIVLGKWDRTVDIYR